MPSPALPSLDAPAFRAALLTWYDQERRPLPWRVDVSVYRTVVSELMAQQTQIDTMLPYFARWMQRFPDFATLAAAPIEEVLKHWEGLGYYRRARLLHQLAQAVSALPTLPRTAAEWQELPGIGPYTAAAIASIHFADPTPVIDGNVIRVLSRLSADPTLWTSSQLAQKKLGPLAARLLDPERPGDYNQAIMELGALRCRKVRPDCLLCPVRPWCHAYALGTPEAFPVIQRKASEKVELDRAWAVHDGQLLLARATSTSRRLADLYELPLLADLPGATRGALYFTGKRGITHQQITERVYHVELEEPSALPEPFRWASPADLARLTLSGPHRKWIAQWGGALGGG